MNSVNESEKLGRYIYCKRHYRSSDNTVKYSALMPRPYTRLSVFIISDLNESEIWSIGENLRNDMELKGRADIIAANVYKSKLDIEVDNNPERHAEIVNWPEEESAMKLKAMELAQNAILRLK